MLQAWRQLLAGLQCHLYSNSIGLARSSNSSLTNNCCLATGAGLGQPLFGFSGQQCFALHVGGAQVDKCIPAVAALAGHTGLLLQPGTP